MLYLRADFANSLSTDYSIFVTFNYNPNYVNLIKSMNNRAWNNANKEWEVGWDCYSQLIGTLNNNNIAYNGQEFMASIENLKQQVEKLKAVQKQEANVDASILDSVEFKTMPFNYQKEGIAYGLTHDKFLLADQPGLGKSLMSANIARLKRGGQHCLVICGYKSLLFNWVKEIQTHTTENGYVIGQRQNKRNLRFRTGKVLERLEDLQNIDKIEEFFLITDITTLRQCHKTEYKDKNGKTRYNKEFYMADAIEDLCRKGIIGRIILDESHVFKNIDVDQTQALLKLKSCPYKIAMTGTPIMNKNIDLYPIMVWLGQETRNYWQFRDRYCKLGGFKGKQIVGDKNNPELHERLSKFMLRRLKQDVLDLPEKIMIDELLEMDGKQWALYEKTSKLAKAEMAKMKGNKNALLASMANLRKITCHPAWVDPNCTDSVKYERARQIVFEAAENNEKTIIFSCFTTPFEAELECLNLKRELEMYNPAMIIGDTKDRMEQVDKFQNDPTCKVIIGSIGAMGVGLTLNAASNVIFLDEPWNQAIKDQAIDRSHRVGTKNNVKVYTLMCKDTVDEGVHKTVTKKGRLALEIVDGVTAEELENIILGNT